jgi:hypothetical protein
VLTWVSTVLRRVAAWLDALSSPQESDDAGGPPAHWRALVQKHAPHLLEPDVLEAPAQLDQPIDHGTSRTPTGKKNRQPPADITPQTPHTATQRTLRSPVSLTSHKINVPDQQAPLPKFRLSQTQTTAPATEQRKAPPASIAKMPPRVRPAIQVIKANPPTPDLDTRAAVNHRRSPPRHFSSHDSAPQSPPRSVAIAHDTPAPNQFEAQIAQTNIHHEHSNLTIEQPAPLTQNPAADRWPALRIPAQSTPDPIREQRNDQHIRSLTKEQLV